MPANNETFRAAVATKDGLSINLHFGHAKSFYIYDVVDGEKRFLEQRFVENYCHGQTGSQSAMSLILETIKDCDFVFSAKVGDGPVAKLKAIGVESVVAFAYEGVEESLLAFSQQSRSHDSGLQ